MDALAAEDLQTILLKLEKFEKQRLQHNARVKRYRESNLERAREYSCKKATQYYWQKKGYTIDANGKRIKIEETIEPT